MAQEQIFAPGIRLFDKHPNAPDFVLASQVISLEEFFTFCQQNPQFLADYQGKKQIKLQILRSKDGKIYTAIDTYGTAAQQAPAPTQGWGAAPAPQQQAPTQWAPAAAPPAQQPAQWGAPQQQPAQTGWGAPQQPQAASSYGPQPVPGDLPF